ncbi:hypothetical protein Pla110_35960 [Polystyrenella longa]|uniref:Uncharacterized protein n=1 Tax=Polystyrenella longa TaxID=2528007 RepID=A0A518CRL0_9PLAN|nr:hypothetical protein [Polystyrenella longa]QDU81845.1 hypothetical protein Pla110_35960 [Polystyrenella longa]
MFDLISSNLKSGRLQRMESHAPLHTLRQPVLSLKTILSLKTASSLTRSFLLLLFCAMPLAAQETPEEGRARIPRPEVKKPKDPQREKALQKVLENWSESSKRIDRLEAEHIHYKFDHTFQVVYQSRGKVFFEAPGKGRIDMQPIKQGNNGGVGAKHEVEHNGVKRKYNIQEDQEESWISDGELITQIKESDKTYIELPIPKELHGSNVMNGPLPFLFGLPPEEARRRFDLELMDLTKDSIVIKATPRTAMDHQNFKVALIKLSPQNYLPQGVKLFEGSDSDETYMFKDFEINKKGFLGGVFDKDPFKPNLSRYSRVQLPEDEKQNKTTMMPQLGGQQLPVPRPQTQNVTPIVPPDKFPNLIGLGHKEAKAEAEKLGFKTSFVPGKSMENEEYHYKVYDMQVIEKDGEKVLRMTVYDNPNRVKN